MRLFVSTRTQDQFYHYLDDGTKYAIRQHRDNPRGFVLNIQLLSNVEELL